MSTRIINNWLNSAETIFTPSISCCGVESCSEGLNVVGTIANVIGGIACFFLGNPGLGLIMLGTSALTLSGSQTIRHLNRMEEVERSSLILRSSVTDLTRENQNLSNEIARVQSAVSQLEDRNRDLNNTNANLAARTQELTAIIQNGDQTLRARYEEINTLNQRAAVIQTKLETTEIALANTTRLLNKTEKSLNKSVENAAHRISCVTDRIETVTVDLENASGTIPGVPRTPRTAAMVALDLMLHG